MCVYSCKAQEVLEMRVCMSLQNLAGRIWMFPTPQSLAHLHDMLHTHTHTHGLDDKLTVSLVSIPLGKRSGAPQLSEGLASVLTLLHSDSGFPHSLVHQLMTTLPVRSGNFINQGRWPPP